MRWRVLLAYAVLYVVWGSTYLAMKIAVTTLPAMLAASLRFFFSGLVLLIIGRVMSAAPIERAQIKTSVLQGVFLLVVGNASVMWAMKSVPSGVGALIIAATPLFMAVFSGDRRPRTWAGIALGVCGIAVLVEPWSTERAVPVGGAALLVLAAVSWAWGSLLPRRMPVHPSNSIATGIQMLTGAIVQLVIGLALGESIEPATVSLASVRAVVYLAVFGSLLGFTAYGWLLRVEPPSRVATYAYVNPVVAVCLGAALGGEPLSARVGIAAVVIIAGVVLIVTGRRT